MDNRNKKVVEEKLKKLDQDPQVEDPQDEEPEPQAPAIENEDSQEVQDEQENNQLEDKGEDYQDKFKNSAREALILHARNKQFQESIEKASTISEVTDDEMVEYAKSRNIDIESLEDYQLAIIKDTIMANKRFAVIQQTAEESKKIDQWADKVDTFVSDERNLEQYPEIAGQENEFREFCMKPSRRGLEMDILVKAFLFDVEKAPAKKKSLLLSGGNGGSSAPKPRQMSAEDAKILRTTSPKKYNQLLKEGKIKFDL